MSNNSESLKLKMHKTVLQEAKGFDVNIEKATVDNNYFRKVLFTTDNIQLVVMSIKDEIGMETHDTIDQFIRVESGTGKSSIDGREFPIKSETAFIVPKGSKHNVWNTGKENLKLYSVYTPANHPPGTVDKTREDAIQREEESGENLEEAGFEHDPKGWDKNSIQKYTNTFTKQMKGGAKAKGFFKKCVEKMKDKMDNPEGFCASLKDESHGSTGRRGKDKSPKEVNKDVKKAKFKVESDTAIDEYLDFNTESNLSGIINEGAPLPNELILMLEYDERPNWIGNCIRKYDGLPRSQVTCLQAVKEYAAANPFYQYRIDRYIDRIMDNWDGASEVPYPTQNPDEREMNSPPYEKGYSNMDHEEPGIVENFPDMSGGGGMGCRVPPADTSETEERDEDGVVQPPIKWSGGKKKSGVNKLKSVDVDNDKRLASDHRMQIKGEE